MKKLTKILLCLILCVFAFGLAACGKKAIMHPDSNAEVVGNGGLAVRKGNYLYFVNGFKSADSMEKPDASYTVGAILVARLGSNGDLIVQDNGQLDSGNYATVSNKLSGFEATSLNIYGDYLYFTSPCQEENSNGDWEKGLVLFYRVRLDGTKKAEKLYQSKSNNSDLEYAYYYDGKNVHLAVYEKSSSELVLINTTNKDKFRIGNINSTTMQLNNSGTVLYSKSAENNKYEVHKINMANRSDVNLGLLDKAITVKFASGDYFFYEKENEYGGDKHLYYLSTSSQTIEDSAVCWQSVNNLSSYTLSPDGKSLIGIRGTNIEYKFNWAITPNANSKIFSAETGTINLIGTTNSTIFYYCADSEDSSANVIKTFNFSGDATQSVTIGKVKNINTNYFDVNEDYLYFYKTVGNNSYLHRLQVSNNSGEIAEHFVGIYLAADIPEKTDE